ncbi:MAG TPA: M56 family metallopeptidase [Armatimonadota bacterium]|nr:M56 family metallopeptidase [Armatimonadota bacterium]
MNPFVGALERIPPLWLAALERACWQGGLYILAVWGLCLAFPRLPARVRFWLWWLACLKLLASLCWSQPIPLPLLPAPSPPPMAAPARSTEAAANVNAMSPDLPAARVPVARNQAAPAPEPSSVKAIGPRPAVPGRQQAPPVSLPSLAAVLMAAWAAGALFWFLILTGQCWRMARLRASAVPVQDEAVLSMAKSLGRTLGLRRAPVILEAAALGPLTTGLLRPAIILPPGLSLSDLRMALAHELAHLKHRDLWWTPALALAQSLFFFHPLAWIACREAAAASETACDREALRITGAPVADYVNLLIRLLAADSRPGLAAALGATSSYHYMKGRLKVLNHSSIPTNRPWKLGLSLLIAAAGLAVVPWMLATRPDPELRAIMDVLSQHPKQIRSAAFDYVIRPFSPHHPDAFWNSIKVPGDHAVPEMHVIAPPSGPWVTRYSVAFSGARTYSSLGSGTHVDLYNGKQNASLIRNPRQPWEVRLFTAPPFSSFRPPRWLPGYQAEGDWIVKLLRRTHPRVVGHVRDARFGTLTEVEIRENKDGILEVHRFWFAAAYDDVAVRTEAEFSDPAVPGISLLLTYDCTRLERYGAAWIPMALDEQTWYSRSERRTLLFRLTQKVTHARVDDVPDSLFALPPLPKGTILRVVHEGYNNNYMIGRHGERIFRRRVSVARPPRGVRLLRAYPGIYWTIYPSESAADRAAFLDAAKQLREAWRSWAKQHRDLLTRMLSAEPDDRLACMAAYDALPGAPPFQRAEQTSPSHPAGSALSATSRLGWGWMVAPVLPLGNSTLQQRVMADRWKGLRQDYAQFRDIPIVRFHAPFPHTIRLWASGRLTENAPSPTVRDGIAREVLPPFEFLPR